MTLPPPVGWTEARAALANGLAIRGEEPTFQADPGGLAQKARADRGVQLLLGMAERFREADPQPPIETAGVDDLVVGLDVGGTDLKVIALSADEVVYTATTIWSLPPRDMHDGSAYIPVLGEQIRRAERAVGRKAAAVGLSFPDLCRGQSIVGGVTSKTRTMRRTHGNQYWRVFDETMRPLARRLGTQQGLPVHLMADGVAAAAWASSQGHRSALVLSLGTSLAAATVDAEGRAQPWPLYGGAAVIRPHDADPTAHRTTGIPGSLQQYPTQTGLFRAIGRAPSSAEADARAMAALQASHEPDVNRHFTEAGHALAEGIDLFRAWLGQAAVHEVVVLGRLTRPGPGTDALLAAARASSPVPIHLPSNAPGTVDTRTHGQALGAALVARGDA